MSAQPLTDELWLWWRVDPARPRLVGTLRHVRRNARQAGGVSLEYAPRGWPRGRL